MTTQHDNESTHEGGVKRGGIFQRTKKHNGPIVTCVRFPENEDGITVKGLDFIFENGTRRASNLSDSLSDISETTSANRMRSRQFTLQPPHEYIVCVRLNEGFDGNLTGIQVQTNLGRRSRFYGIIPSQENKSRLGVRHELFAAAGEAIISFGRRSGEGEDGMCSFEIKTSSKPYVKRKKLRRLMLLPSVRSALTKTNESGKSTINHFMRGGTKAVALNAVRSGLAGKMLSAGEDGDALARLVLDGEQVPMSSFSSGSSVASRRNSNLVAHKISSIFGMSAKHDEEKSDSDDDSEDLTEDSIAFPPSLLRALCEPGKNFQFSLLDLLGAGRERDGRPPVIRVLFDSGIAKVVFKRHKGHKCIAELLMTPDRVKGLRSLMQLMTDDEALDDPQRPSLLRSMLIGEETGSKPSVLRLMFKKTPGLTITSLLDEFLKGEDNCDSSARRLLSETPERPVSLARLFFSDTASGKPALAKYMLGGESEVEDRPSLFRLLVQGESRQQASLLRLLIGYRGASGKTLMDLMTQGQPSLMDLLLKGEDSAGETSLARQMLGTTFTIQDGRVVMGSALGTSSMSPSALVSKQSISADQKTSEDEAASEHLRRRLERGLTIAKVTMLGEEDGGPGISVMRVLLMGEEFGTSVLRLLLTGEEVNEVSPLRIIFTGLHTMFIVAMMARDTSKDLESESLLDMAIHPSKWRDALVRIMKAVVASVQESHSSDSTWRESFDKLIELAKDKLRSKDSWQENLAFLYTAFARVRSMGPEFAKVWKRQWNLVSKEILNTGHRVRPDSPWKVLAPVVAEFTNSIADQQWQRVFLNVAQILQAVEKAAGRKGDKNLARVVYAFEGLQSWAPKWF